MSRRVVVAIGGNSLIRDKDHTSIADQFARVEKTCRHIGEMIAKGWDVVITHGNGPQVGFVLRRSELASDELHEVPLDSAVADTQGSIGYMIQRAMHNELARRGIPKQSVAVVTQVLVDSRDPAFHTPTKPVGAFLSRDAALRHRAEGWAVAEDAGRGWRRVVPSPIPRRIVEIDAIDALMERGMVVIAAGGGGIPVVEVDGRLIGVEAVIDKDYASALLAAGIHADLLLISTSVDGVALNLARPDEVWLDCMTVEEARYHLADGQFPAGNMGPKIEASIWFLEHGGLEAVITSPERIGSALAGRAGTRILPASTVTSEANVQQPAQVPLDVEIDYRSPTSRGQGL